MGKASIQNFPTKVIQYVFLGCLKLEISETSHVSACLKPKSSRIIIGVPPKASKSMQIPQKSRGISPRPLRCGGDTARRSGRW